MQESDRMELLEETYELDAYLNNRIPGELFVVLDARLEVFSIASHIDALLSIINACSS